MLQSRFYAPSSEILLPVRYVAADAGDCGLGSLAMLLNQDLVIGLVKKYKCRPYYEEKLGWIHQGLVEIAQGYGLELESKRCLTLSQLGSALKQGQPVMVSLKVPAADNLGDNVYTPHNPVLGQTQHLCLLVGQSPEGFYVHDPRNIGSYQQNLLVPFAVFARIFSGTGLVAKNWARVGAR